MPDFFSPQYYYRVLNGMSKRSITELLTLSYNQLKYKECGIAAKIIADSVIYREDLPRITTNYHTYSKQKQITIDSPEYGIEQTPKRLFSLMGDYERPQPFVCTVDNIKLMGGYAIPHHQNGVINEVCFARRDYLDKFIARDLEFFIQSTFRDFDPVKTYDVVCSFASVGPGYCGWVQSILTQLWGLNVYENITGTSPKILLPSNPRSWMVDSLSFFGYDDFIEWDGCPTKINKLIIPSVMTGESKSSFFKMSSPTVYDDKIRIVDPDACRWLRENAHNRIDSPKRNIRNTYISREFADNRQVSNFQEVKRLLSQFGFEFYCFENISFERQVELMASSDIVVAPHGAGLVNTIFADENTTIVELFGKRKKPTFFSLSKSVNNDYGFLLCDSINGDIYVDIQELDQIISEIINY